MSRINTPDGLATARSDRSELVRWGAGDIKVNIKFDFDSLSDKEFYFVCGSSQCDNLCKALSRHFKKLEKDQYQDVQGDDYLLDPDAQFYHDITSKRSVFRKKVHTKREHHGSITITISRAEYNDSWVFRVTDLNKVRWNISRCEGGTNDENPNWKPGCYEPSELFQHIVRRFAFNIGV